MRRRHRKDLEYTMQNAFAYIHSTSIVYQGVSPLPFAFLGFSSRKCIPVVDHVFATAATSAKVNSIDISRSEGKSWYVLLSFLSFFPEKSA